ncbi:MAG: hypothetical protein KC502_22340 [Myxococcales bacterium]|nr:hypothetical protein [Myxococcales bacterium]
MTTPSALWTATLRTVPLAILVLLSACEPTRAPLDDQPCSGTQHCPATGEWTCDLVKKVCVKCEGACPGTGAETNDVGTVDAGADAATTTDDVATGADALSTSDAAAADASAQVASCVGRCGQYDSNWLCNCDDGCAEFDDCCPDLAAVCETAADASGGSDAGSTSDSAALPDSATGS